MGVISPARVTLRTAIVAAIAFGPSPGWAQDVPDRFAPSVAVARAWRLLTSAIESGTPEERSAALSALSSARTSRALDMLERLAGDATYPRRSTAVWFLPEEAQYLPLLAEALHDSNSKVRDEAIHKLGGIRDPGSLPLLQKVLFDDDEQTIQRGASALRQHGSKAFGVLLEAIETGPERTRTAAVDIIDLLVSHEFSAAATDNLAALASLRPDGALIKLLGDSNAEASIHAAFVLARLGNDAAIDVLIRASTAADPRLGSTISAYSAMAALNALGHSEYLPVLGAALHNPDDRARMSAAYAMQAFPHSAFRTILSEIWDGTEVVRFQLFDALISLRGPPEVGLLRAGLADADPSLRLRAAESLLELGPDNASLDVLAQLAADPSFRNRALSDLRAKVDVSQMAILARQLLPKAIDELAQWRRSSNYLDGAAYTLIELIGLARDPKDVAQLSALWTSDQNFNRSVARALVTIGDDSARRALILAMDNRDRTATIQAAGGVVSLDDR